MDSPTFNIPDDYINVEKCINILIDITNEYDIAPEPDICLNNKNELGSMLSNSPKDGCRLAIIPSSFLYNCSDLDIRNLKAVIVLGFGEFKPDTGISIVVCNDNTDEKDIKATSITIRLMDKSYKYVTTSLSMEFTGLVGNILVLNHQTIFSYVASKIDFFCSAQQENIILTIEEKINMIKTLIYHHCGSKEQVLFGYRGGTKAHVLKGATQREGIQDHSLQYNFIQYQRNNNNGTHDNDLDLMIEGKNNKENPLMTPLMSFDLHSHKSSLFYACTDNNPKKDRKVGKVEYSSYIAVLFLNSHNDYQDTFINKMTDYDISNDIFLRAKNQPIINGYYAKKKECVLVGLYDVDHPPINMAILEIPGVDKAGILHILKKDKELIKQTNTCDINAVEDLLSFAENLEQEKNKEKDQEKNYLQHQPTFVFRGHANISFDLIPTVGRSQTYTEENEQLLFEKFKRSAFSYFSSKNIIHEIDKLAIAQHYKCQTRLLDFTTNPLSSLWFACSDFNGQNGEVKDGMLYILDTSNIEKYNMDTELDLTDIKTNYLYTPPILEERLKTQQGLFILPQYANRNLDTAIEEKYFEHYTINGFKKVDILKQLYKMGVTSESLYHGLDGIGTTASWVYQNKEKTMTKVSNFGYVQTQDIVDILKSPAGQAKIFDNLFHLDMDKFQTQNSYIDITLQNNKIILTIHANIYVILERGIYRIDKNIKINNFIRTEDISPNHLFINICFKEPKIKKYDFYAILNDNKVLNNPNAVFMVKNTFECKINNYFKEYHFNQFIASIIGTDITLAITEYYEKVFINEIMLTYKNFKIEKHKIILQLLMEVNISYVVVKGEDEYTMPIKKHIEYTLKLGSIKSSDKCLDLDDFYLEEEMDILSLVYETLDHHLSIMFY